VTAIVGEEFANKGFQLLRTRPLKASPTRPPAIRKPEARSRVTNGALLPHADGRSTWCRRCTDLIEAHISDLGGDDAISEAERSIIRRAAVIATELERMEETFALAGQATASELDAYQRAAGSLRRLLESIGLQRRAVAMPSLSDYLASKRYSEDEAAA
jgi:hypothetical protein